MRHLSPDAAIQIVDVRSHSGWAAEQHLCEPASLREPQVVYGMAGIDGQNCVEVWSEMAEE